MAQVTLKIKLDLPGLRSEVQQALSEIEGQLGNVEEIEIDADTSQAVSAVDEVTEGVEETKSASDSTRESFAQWGMILTGIQAAIGLIKQGVGMINNIVSATEKQQLAVKSLSLALKQNGDLTSESANRAAKDFEKWAGGMQQVTNFGDEVIIQAGTMASRMMDLNATGLKPVIIAAADLSAVMGSDLNASIRMISNAVEGGMAPFRGASKELLHMIQTAETSSERMAIILKAIEEKFGGSAKVMRSELTAIDNTMGDTTEAIGEVLQKAYFPLLRVIGDISVAFQEMSLPTRSLTFLVIGLTAAIVGFNISTGGMALIIGGIVTGLSGMIALLSQSNNSLLDQQAGFNALINVMKSVNTSQDTRNRAIAELQSKYPDYIKNIDLEKASVQELAAIQRLANKEFREAIKLKAAQNILRELDEAVQSVQQKIFKAEAKLLEEFPDKIGQTIGVVTKQIDSFVKQTYIENISLLKEQLVEEEKALNKFEVYLKGKGIDITKLKLKNINKVIDEDKKGLKEREEAYKDFTETELELIDKIIDKDIEAANKGFNLDELKIASAKELAQKKLGIMDAGLDKELAALEVHLEAERKKYKDDKEMLTLIDKEETKKKAAIEDRYYEKQEQKRTAAIQAEMQKYEVLRGFLLSFLDEELNRTRSFSNAEIQLRQIQHNKELKSLRDQLESGQITREEYDARTRIAAQDQSDFMQQVEKDRQDWTMRLADKTTKFLIKLGADLLSKFAVQKIAEATIHTAAEAEKTAATEAGTLERLALMAMEVVKSLTVAASKILVAIAEGIASLFASLGPFAILAIGAMVAGVMAIWNGLKSALGFKKGGYTGDGDPNEVAGVTHKREYVYEAVLVKKEPEKFEMLHKMLRSGFTLEQIIALPFALANENLPTNQPSKNKNLSPNIEDKNVPGRTETEGKAKIEDKHTPIDIRALVALPEMIIKATTFLARAKNALGIGVDKADKSTRKRDYNFEAALATKNPEKFKLIHKMLRSGMTLTQVFTRIAEQVNPIIQAPVALAGINLSTPVVAVGQSNQLSKIESLLSSMDERLKKIEEKNMTDKIEIVGESRIEDKHIYISFKRQDKFESKRIAKK